MITHQIGNGHVSEVLCNSSILCKLFNEGSSEIITKSLGQTPTNIKNTYAGKSGILEQIYK